MCFVFETKLAAVGKAPAKLEDSSHRQAKLQMRLTGLES